MMFLKLRRFLTVFLLLPLIILALGITTADAARNKKKRAVSAEPDRFAEIVIEAKSGYVLSEKNADKRLYPASLTKMMTLYLAFDALDDGTIGKNTRVRVSRYAASQEPSAVGFAPGDTVRIDDLIRSIATKSANDSSVVMAEALGGSEERFARMMTAKGRELGMTGTNFLNPSGLHRKGHYSTARDMAILSRALILNHPRHYHYFSLTSFTYKGQVMGNHNRLMSTYRGMDGLKTGYVYASGYNLAASAVRDGTRLIGVVFGGRTAKSRNNAMAQLLDQSFVRMRNIRLASSGEEADEEPTPAPQQRKRVTVPAQRTTPVARPAVPQDNSHAASPETVAANMADTGPLFDAMGLVMDQGDAAYNPKNEQAQRSVDINHPSLQPQPMNNTPIASASSLQPTTLYAPANNIAANNSSNWAIQIGAFTNQATGKQALQSAKASLQGIISGIESIAPLMTPQGMIYRARLSGLSRNGAQQACGVLKGSCLVLAVE